MITGAEALPTENCTPVTRVLPVNQKRLEEKQSLLLYFLLIFIYFKYILKQTKNTPSTTDINDCIWNPAYVPTEGTLLHSTLASTVLFYATPGP